MKFIDTHAHILKGGFNDELPSVIEQCLDRDLVCMNIAYNMVSSIESIKLSKEHPGKFYAFVGVHPAYANTVSENYIDKLEELILNNDVKGIGEIGMDFFWEPYDEETQAKVFREQLALAQKHNLSVVIHSRAAIEACYEIMKEYPEINYLVHSWEHDKEVVDRFFNTFPNMNYSFNGIITFKNAKLQQEVIKHIPLDRLMFETDCPYLSPEPNRGKTNYPWRVEDVIKFCAGLLDMPVEELNDINNKNAEAFFKLK